LTGLICGTALIVSAAAAAHQRWMLAEAEPAGPVQHAAPARPLAQSPLIAPVTGWLEQAARTYQSEIADKLAVPRPQYGSEGILALLRDAVVWALDYASFWLARAYEAAGLSPPDRHLALVAKPAQRREAAPSAQETPGAKTADADVAAEKKRAEDRKAELEKLKQELDRQIAEGMKKLEDFKKDQARVGTEAARKKALAAEEEARKAEERRRLEEDSRQEQKRKTEDARKAEEVRKVDDARKTAGAKRIVEAQALYARSVAVAQDSRKTEEALQAEQLRKTEDAKRAEAAEAARKAAESKAAEERRQAEAAARKAAAAEEDARKVEAAKKRAEAAEAEAARKTAAEKRQAEAAVAEESGKTTADGQTRKADRIAEEKQVTQARSDYAERVAAAERARKTREASPSPDDTAPAPPSRMAEDEPRAKEKAEATPRPVERTSEVQPRRNRERSKPANRERRRTAVIATRGKGRAERNGQRLHTVKRGETLWDISRRYLRAGARYADIFEANRRSIRDPDLIYPCQRLRLPRESD
jgi:nucleoid-associated protein YgaU